MGEDTALLRDILSVLREIRDSPRTGGVTAGARAAAPAPSGKGGEVAGDRELDSSYGNPAVRKDPKNWQGASFVGCNFSECAPDYLDDLAGLFDWMADKDEQEDRKTTAGKPSAPYKRRDAARARGWALRIRNGWKPTAATPAEEGGADAADDSIPF